MSHWNYRVVRVRGDEEDTYEFREVYYNDDGTVHCMTVAPAAPRGDDQNGLKWVLGRMQAALDMPILEDD